VSPGRSLWRFLFLAAIGHEVSYTLVKADRLDSARQRLTNIWIGLTLAGIYRPNLLAHADRRSSVARQVANVAADAALIALATRGWHEGLAVLRREILARQTEAEVEPAPRIEIERPVLPGISIRSYASRPDHTS
jgi:hypothetical protein